MHGAGRAGDGCEVGSMPKVCASMEKMFMGKDERGSSILEGCSSI